MRGEPFSDDPSKEEPTPGGWSMDGQPQDAIHGVYHKRKDAHERATVVFSASTYLPWQDCIFDPTIGD